MIKVIKTIYRRIYWFFYRRRAVKATIYILQHGDVREIQKTIDIVIKIGKNNDVPQEEISKLEYMRDNAERFILNRIGMKQR